MFHSNAPEKRVQFLILRVLGSRKSSKRNFCGHSSVFGLELFHGQKAKQSKQLKSEIGGQFVLVSSSTFGSSAR